MKKQHKNPAQTDRMWALTSDPKLKSMLHHLLSPLEMQAIKNRFTPFTYDLDGVPLFVDSHACNMMLFDAKMRVKYYHELVRANRIIEAKKDSKKWAFLVSSPGDIPEISKKLATQLSRCHLKTMADIARRGSFGMRGYTRIGDKVIAELTAVFKIYKCDNIFITTKYK